MHFATLFATAAAIAGLATAAPNSVGARQVPNCPAGQLICGFELRSLGYTREQLFAIITASGAEANDIRADGLFRCKDGEPGLEWVTSCKDDFGNAGLGGCNGRNSQNNPPNADAYCRNGAAN